MKTNVLNPTTSSYIALISLRMQPFGGFLLHCINLINLWRRRVKPHAVCPVGGDSRAMSMESLNRHQVCAGKSFALERANAILMTWVTRAHANLRMPHFPVYYCSMFSAMSESQYIFPQVLKEHEFRNCQGFQCQYFKELSWNCLPNHSCTSQFWISKLDTQKTWVWMTGLHPLFSCSENDHMQPDSVQNQSQTFWLGAPQKQVENTGTAVME